MDSCYPALFAVYIDDEVWHARWAANKGSFTLWLWSDRDEAFVTADTVVNARYRRDPGAGRTSIYHRVLMPVLDKAASASRAAAPLVLSLDDVFPRQLNPAGQLTSARLPSPSLLPLRGTDCFLSQWRHRQRYAESVWRGPMLIHHVARPGDTLVCFFTNYEKNYETPFILDHEQELVPYQQVVPEANALSLLRAFLAPADLTDGELVPLASVHTLDCMSLMQLFPFCDDDHPERGRAWNRAVKPLRYEQVDQSVLPSSPPVPAD